MVEESLASKRASPRQRAVGELDGKPLGDDDGIWGAPGTQARKHKKAPQRLVSSGFLVAELPKVGMRGPPLARGTSTCICRRGISPSFDVCSAGKLPRANRPFPPPPVIYQGLATLVDAHNCASFGGFPSLPSWQPSPMDAMVGSGSGASQFLQRRPKLPCTCRIKLFFLSCASWILLLWCLSAQPEELVPCIFAAGLADTFVEFDEMPSASIGSLAVLTPSFVRFGAWPVCLFVGFSLVTFSCLANLLACPSSQFVRRPSVGLRVGNQQVKYSRTKGELGTRKQWHKKRPEDWATFLRSHCPTRAHCCAGWES
ncbi:hypothetical protein VTK26DRAFT_1422 [Humicola hyalothermophila]